MAEGHGHTVNVRLSHESDINTKDWCGGFPTSCGQRSVLIELMDRSPTCTSQPISQIPTSAAWENPYVGKEAKDLKGGAAAPWGSWPSDLSQG